MASNNKSAKTGTKMATKSSKGAAPSTAGKKSVGNKKK